MDFNGLFEMQGMLFLLMALGYLLRKRGLITKEGKQLLTDLVLFVTLPASILKSFQMEMTHEILMGSLAVTIVAFLIQVGAFLLGLVLYPGRKDEDKRVLQYATICSNAGILGNTIAEGIFGSTGLLYAAIYTIPQRVLMWSVGLTYFTTAPSKKQLVKKILTHPCILAVFAGLLLMVTQFTLPGPLNLTVKTIAGGNTFLAMLLVGTILSEIPFRKLLDREVFYYCLIRLGLIPLLVYLACRLAHVDSLVSAVCVVLSGMPSAATTAVLASRYHKNEELGVKLVVLSTLLSMITIPLWCIFLG